MFQNWIKYTSAAVAISMLVHVDVSADDSSANASDPSEVAEAAESKRVTVEVARDHAKLMHSIYKATLDVMHDRYFHADRAVVPARAMEDVFLELKRQSDVQARWISANLKPMSVSHKPETKFEKQAAKEIGNGKPDVEIVEDGFYRRAGAIPIGSGCISCHSGFFKNPSKKPKFAALVISIPVSDE